MRTLKLLMAAVLVLSGCSGSDGSTTASLPVVPTVEEQPQQLGFAEHELGSKRLGPGETAVLYLETPDEDPHQNDLGGHGFDHLPLRLPGDAVLTVSGEGTDGAVILDSAGQVVDGSRELPAGEYTLELPGTGQFHFLHFGFEAQGRGSATLQGSYNPVGANLAGVNLTGQELFRTNFSGANLTGANLTGSQFTQCIFAGANMSSTTLDGVLFFECALQNSTMQQAAGQGTTFASDLTGADLSSSTFNNVGFNGASLGGCNFQGAQIIGSSFAGAMAVGANFSRSTLTNNDMTASTFAVSTFLGATLSGNNFGQADMSGVTWVDGRILPQGQAGSP